MGYVGSFFLKKSPISDRRLLDILQRRPFDFKECLLVSQSYIFILVDPGLPMLLAFLVIGFRKILPQQTLVIGFSCYLDMSNNKRAIMDAKNPPKLVDPGSPFKAPSMLSLRDPREVANQKTRISYFFFLSECEDNK